MRIEFQPTAEEFRARARELLIRRVAPEVITWDDGTTAEPTLFKIPAAVHFGRQEKSVAAPTVPRRFLKLLDSVAAHRSSQRWTILYRVLWRLNHENADLLKVEVDDDVSALLSMEKQVRHDIHKMHAFVRFRKVESEHGEQFVAWYAPDHNVLRLAAPFFADRFASMKWSILTPDCSVSSADGPLQWGRGVPSSEAPRADELDALWRTYYRSIFNPARTNVAAMRREMPVRFWSHLPESGTIAALLSEAPQRVEGMLRAQRQAPSAAAFVPANAPLSALAVSANACRGCELWHDATQAVFGVGPADARIMLVGEQPGDMEDRHGLPFVGPAGMLLDRALEQAGLTRDELYMTNAVKHFKHEPRGKERIHRTPDRLEVVACQPWLRREIELVSPSVLVCLGVTAARSLISAQFRLMEQRGEVIATRWAARTVATVHPAAVLRATDSGQRERLFGMLVADLKTAGTMSA